MGHYLEIKLGKIDPEEETLAVFILNIERIYWPITLLWRSMLQTIT